MSPAKRRPSGQLSATEDVGGPAVLFIARSVPERIRADIDAEITAKAVTGWIARGRR